MPRPTGPREGPDQRHRITRTEPILVRNDHRAHFLDRAAGKCRAGSMLAASLATHPAGADSNQVTAAANAHRAAGRSEPWRTILPPTPTAPASPLVIPPTLGPRRVDIRIYGQVRVLVDGQELVKALPDAGRQVLALLTVRGELTEDEIVDSLGAGSVDQIWRSRFVRGTRGSRPALREALGDSTIDPMPFDGGVYRLDPDLVSSDFRRLLAGRDAALATTHPEHRVALLTRGTEGIRGAPFTKADYLWLADDQEHVRSVAVDTLSQLAELHAAAGDLDKAIDTLDQALTLDPDPIEDLFRQQMLWQHRLGRPQAARDVYHQLVRQLSDRCDRIPSEETTALLESLGGEPRVMVR